MLLHLTSLSIIKVLKASYYKNVILQRPKLVVFISGFEMWGSGFYRKLFCGVQYLVWRIKYRKLEFVRLKTKYFKSCEKITTKHPFWTLFVACSSQAHMVSLILGILFMQTNEAHQTVFRAQINLSISGTLCWLVPGLQTMHTLDPGTFTSWVLCFQDRFSDPRVGCQELLSTFLSHVDPHLIIYRAQIKRDRGESQNFRGWNVRVRVRHLSQTET